MHLTNATSPRVKGTYCPYPSYNSDEDLSTLPNIDELSEIQLDQHSPAIGIHTDDITDISLSYLNDFFAEFHEIWEDKSPWVQTDIIKLTPSYIHLFKEHSVRLNVPAEGPIEAVDLKLDTTPSLEDILSIDEQGVDIYPNIVMHNGNIGTNETRSELIDWMDELNEHQIWGSLQYPPQQNMVSLDSITSFYEAVWEWMLKRGDAIWFPHSYIGRLMMGSGNQNPSIPGRQHPFHTGKPITISDGVNIVTELVESEPFAVGIPKFTHGDNIRTVQLMSALDESGGCRKCEYWDICKGGLVENANSWKERTVYCDPIYQLFENVASVAYAISPMDIDDTISQKMEEDQ